MDAKRSTRVPRKVWLVVALVVGAGAVLLAQDSTVVVPDMASYAVVDQRTIAMTVALPHPARRYGRARRSGADGLTRRRPLDPHRGGRERAGGPVAVTGLIEHDGVPHSAPAANE